MQALLLQAAEVVPDMTSKDLAFWLWGASMLQLVLPAPLVQACCRHAAAHIHDMTPVAAVHVLHGLARQRQLRRQAWRAGPDAPLRDLSFTSPSWPGQEQQQLVLELLGLLRPHVTSLAPQQLSSVVLSVTELAGLHWHVHVEGVGKRQAHRSTTPLAAGTSQQPQQQTAAGPPKAAALEPPVLQQLPPDWLADLLAAVEQHSAAKDVAADPTWGQAVCAAGALEQHFL
jgi:hypothetical protein